MFNVKLKFFFSVVICLLIFTNHASFRDKICLWNIVSSFRAFNEAGGGGGGGQNAYFKCTVSPNVCQLLFSRKYFSLDMSLDVLRFAATKKKFKQLSY